MEKLLTGFVETSTVIMIAYTAAPSSAVTSKVIKPLTV